MNETSTPSWPTTTTHADPMVAASDEDFSHLFNLDDFQLDFANFDGNAQDQNGMHHDAGNAMDTSFDAMGQGLGEQQKEMQMHQQDMQMSQQRPAPPPQQQRPQGDMDGSQMEALKDYDFQHAFYQQQQHHHHQQQQQQHAQMQDPNFQQGAIVPPTPNSIELQGGAARFYQQMDPQLQQAMYERYQRMKEEQMIFTPLVSPAVTPHEAQFRVDPEYTVPGAYFSPLTSPALQAQNHGMHNQYYSNPATTDNSLTTSPVDLSKEGPPNSGTAPANSQRKTRRKTNTGSTSAPRTPGRVVRESPSMKPQSKRRPGSAIIPSRELSELAEEASGAGKTQPQAAKPHQHYQHESSGTDSISPEPLSEALMGPPPAPRSSSASRSPAILPGSQSAPLTAMSNGVTPATPASLMRIQQQKRRTAAEGLNLNLSNGQRTDQDMIDQGMEDLSLPSPATTRPPLARIDTQIPVDGGATPTMTPIGRPRSSTQRTPTLLPGSALQSPSMSALGSPSLNGLGKKLEKPGNKNNRKRNSTSSVQVSPALRPKISPSIKPLLPEGAAVSAETSALLLASKSNYQNILEGTHLPGVSYPEALSTNLTSKRTSHKIAEQGRRNRINNALQEIAALLPPPTPTGPTPADSESVPAGSQTPQQSSSKASTVEMAIDYIKALQQELKETKGKLELAEEQLRDSGLASRKENGISAVSQESAVRLMRNGMTESKDIDVAMDTVTVKHDSSSDEQNESVTVGPAKTNGTGELADSAVPNPA